LVRLLLLRLVCWSGWVLASLLRLVGLLGRVLAGRELYFTLRALVGTRQQSLL
jgi:hypothetical protein